MSKVRIVLDTNVFLVSLSKNFRLHWVFREIVEGNIELCLSTDILNEYQEIIEQRYGLKRTDTTLDFLLLLPNVKLISPQFKWDLLKDKDDNKFVDCAVAGNAEYLVSNDKGFKQLSNVDFPPIKVLTAEEFEKMYFSGNN